MMTDTTELAVTALKSGTSVSADVVRLMTRYKQLDSQDPECAIIIAKLAAAAVELSKCFAALMAAGMAEAAAARGIPMPAIKGDNEGN